jgi:hypothetical protein
MAVEDIEMALNTRPSRGLSDIRTRTGGRAAGHMPVYKSYLRMSFLELERARRLQEVRACRDRVNAIRSRFSEINDEIAAIRAKLDDATSATSTTQAPLEQTVERHTRTKHFRLDY